MERFDKGVSIKNVPRGLFSAYILPTRVEGVFFRCGRPHFLVKKTSETAKFMISAPTRGERGLSQCGNFTDKGGGVDFSEFCVDVFYGRPLMITVSCFNSNYSIFKLHLPLVFCDCFIYQINNGLSNKVKLVLLKYISHNFGSAIFN